ncbi:hypothetical protein S245_063310, partial [Arachis hypogaea]
TLARVVFPMPPIPHMPIKRTSFTSGLKSEFMSSIFLSIPTNPSLNGLISIIHEGLVNDQFNGSVW